MLIVVIIVIVIAIVVLFIMAIVIVAVVIAIALIIAIRERVSVVYPSRIETPSLHSLHSLRSLHSLHSLYFGGLPLADRCHRHSRRRRLTRPAPSRHPEACGEPRANRHAFQSTPAPGEGSLELAPGWPSEPPKDPRPQGSSSQPPLASSQLTYQDSWSAASWKSMPGTETGATGAP